MAISRDTLKAMIRDYSGFDLTDVELDLIQQELENYLAEAAKLRELDLSDVLSARLLRAQEGGQG
jgi:hypothetical protein